jgi:hypothetical protein
MPTGEGSTGSALAAAFFLRPRLGPCGFALVPSPTL